MAKAAKPTPAAETEAPAPNSKKKLVIFGLAGVLILAIAGGAVWYFFLRDTGKHAEEAKAVAAEPTFMVLDPFTVNLQREDGDQFLQIGITLKVASPELADKARQRLPEIRSRLVFLLSSKRASELLPIEGKRKLAQEIMSETNAILGGQHNAAAPETESAPAAERPAAAGGGIQDVLFTSFIIQ
jgi:flagellar FliL protein